MKKIINNLFNLLLLSAFLGALKVPIKFGNFSINLSLSQIIFFLILLCILNSNSFKNSFSKGKLIKDYPSLFIGLYFFLNLISSLFVAGNWESIKGSFVILVYCSIFFVTRYLAQLFVNSIESINKLFYYNFLSVLFGLGAMIYSLVLSPGRNIGVATGHLESGVPSIRSLSFEPNIFAIITSSILCLYISFYIYTKRVKFDYKVFLLVILAILFSYTRSVYLTFAVSILAIIYLSGRVKLAKILIYSFFFLIFGSLILSFTDNSIVDSIVKRSTNITNIEEGSAVGRIEAYNIGYKGFIKSPIFGNGTMTADTRVFHDIDLEYKNLHGSAGWLTGFWIQSLHDTGILGLFVTCGLLFSFLRTNFVAFRKEKKDIVRKSLYLGFFAANIIISITTQASSVMWISFTYIFWGVNMAIIDQLNKEPSSLINTRIKNLVVRSSLNRQNLMSNKVPFE